MPRRLPILRQYHPLTPADRLGWRRQAAIVALALLALTLGGCATGKPLPKAFHDALGTLREAAASASLAELSPSAPKEALYRLYEGGESLAAGDSGAQLTRTTELDLEQRTLRITRLRSIGSQERAAGELEMATTLVAFEDGWAMTRSQTPARGVITEYDPPMLVFPARLAPGEPITQDIRLIVRPADNPQRIQNRGVATNTIELVGAQTVRTAPGSVEALRVRATFVGEFGVARVSRVTDTWHAPGLGLVAEEVHERVTALGAPVSAIDQALLLISAAEQAPTASSARSTSASDSSQ